jgi:16S rRNA (guanine(966)-N(2))-methyltransferase RsmD
VKTDTAPGRIRIIGGQYRRTPIPVVAAPGLRPTPDRVRVTVFNWLEHLLGGLAGRAALDLFAGSGALGFEMASRGARRVVMVDSHPRAAQALRELQLRLNATAIEVLQLDWSAAAAREAPGAFDVVFLDPPFGSDLLAPALAAARRVLKADGLLYVESGTVLADAAAAAAGFGALRSGRAGAVHFQLLRVVAQ